jgi:hypothetical protein
MRNEDEINILRAVVKGHPVDFIRIFPLVQPAIDKNFYLVTLDVKAGTRNGPGPTKELQFHVMPPLQAVTGISYTFFTKNNLGGQHPFYSPYPCIISVQTDDPCRSERNDILL